MALTDTNILEDSLGRIMGQPGTSVNNTPANPVTRTATTPATPGTSANVSAPVAPTVDQAAIDAKKQLDAINAQTQSLLTSMGPASTVPATTQPAAAAAAPAPTYDRYSQSTYTYGQPGSLAVGTAGGEFMPVTRRNAWDPEVRAQLERSMATNTANLAGMEGAPLTGNAALMPAAIMESNAAMQGYLNQPMTGRQFLSEQGITRPQIQAMGRPERQALRGQFQTTRAEDAMKRVAG